MQSLVATRRELLDRRRRAVFVSQGRDLLKDKRTALVREFGRHQAELLNGLEELRKLAYEPRRRLEEATVVVWAGAARVGALVAETGIGAELRSRTVAGVRVYLLRHDPVRRDAADRGWAPAATSIHLDRVASAYEELLQWLLDLCAVELSVRRLATEIAQDHQAGQCPRERRAPPATRGDTTDRPDPGRARTRRTRPTQEGPTRRKSRKPPMNGTTVLEVTHEPQTRDQQPDAATSHELVRELESAIAARQATADQARDHVARAQLQAEHLVAEAEARAQDEAKAPRRDPRPGARRSPPRDRRRHQQRG